MKVALKTLPDEPRGSAWPPSARAVRCPVKSGNEQDLYLQLPPSFCDRALWRDCPGNWEEGAGNGRSVCSESPRLHARNNGTDNGLQPRKGKPILKTLPCPDRGLHLSLVTVESLVISCHHLLVNMSRRLAHTARQTNRAGSR